MTALSVNLNKIAWLRNARAGEARPDLLAAADIAIRAGAQGITVHPRPDLRHILPDDVDKLHQWLSAEAPDIEFNIEGNPFAQANKHGYPGFLNLVERYRPHQCTLVPDAVGQLTSDHGFTASQIEEDLVPVLNKLSRWNVRSSVFMDPQPEVMPLVAQAGANRIELYTGPYAESFQAEAKAQGAAAPNSGNTKNIWHQYLDSAVAAQEAGLGVNAGHDLNLQNLAWFLKIPNILEISIGHALIADALEIGLQAAVSEYLLIIKQSTTT